MNARQIIDGEYVLSFDNDNSSGITSGRRGRRSEVGIIDDWFDASKLDQTVIDSVCEKIDVSYQHRLLTEETLELFISDAVKASLRQELASLLKSMPTSDDNVGYCIDHLRTIMDNSNVREVSHVKTKPADHPGIDGEEFLKLISNDSDR